MPAYLPGAALTPVASNPSAGRAVTFDLLSGPSGSPLDAKKVDYTTGTPPGWSAANRIPVTTADTANISTGALSTGIGFGSPPIMPAGSTDTPKRFENGNFTDDYTPGVSLPSGSAGANSTLMYIGGGRDVIANGSGYQLAAGGNGYPVGWYTSQPSPYTAGYGVGGAGGGVTRDVGAGPAFTGHKLKTVTATGAVLGDGTGVVETGFLNASGVALVSGDTVFGLQSATSGVPALVRGELEEEDDEEDVEEEVDVEEDEDVDEPDDEGVLQRVKRKVMKKKKVVTRKKK